MTPLSPAYRAARKADHETGTHEGLEEFVAGCPLCQVAEEELNAREEAEYAARLKVERKAEREAARARAAWLRDNPDAIAWHCTSCEAELTDDGADQGQGALYECADCGPFSRGNSADGDSNRCPNCGHFGAKLADLACPECNEGELEPVGPEAETPTA